MKEFTFSYPTKVYFGEGAAKRALRAELGKVGKIVMLAYGGGSVKKNGVYDELLQLLTEAGKEVVDFSGIMPNPTYAKVQEGAKLVKERNVDFILAVGGGSVIDCIYCFLTRSFSLCKEIKFFTSKCFSFWQHIKSVKESF